MTKERSKWRKKYQTIEAARTEAKIPTRRPPIQALRNTAGINRNHAKGLMIGEIKNCTKNVRNKGDRARINRANVNLAPPMMLLLVENARFPFNVPSCT